MQSAGSRTTDAEIVDEALAELTQMETHVEEFLHEIQRDVATATSHMLDGVLAAVNRETEAVKTKIPDLRELQTLNANIARSFQAVRDVE